MSTSLELSESGQVGQWKDTTLGWRVALDVIIQTSAVAPWGIRTYSRSRPPVSFLDRALLPVMVQPRYLSSSGFPP